jgi:hypothetical protein
MIDAIVDVIEADVTSYHTFGSAVTEQRVCDEQAAAWQRVVGGNDKQETAQVSRRGTHCI